MAQPTFRQGRILWARLRAQNGKKQLHPAIIITPDQDIVQPEQFDPRRNVDQVNAVAVVGVSTECKRYPPYVELPYSTNRGGHQVTKLTAACGACIGWYDWVVLDDDVEGFGGDVPPAEMDLIMRAIAEDLASKIRTKIPDLQKELAQLHVFLASLIGEP